jgi:DNA integrity scanning protein DisA with diadenylate cyclase activity
MDQNNLSGLFLPAVAGLFFFMKRPKVEEVEEVKTVYPVYTRDPSGLTGVAKYLGRQEATLLASRNAKEQELQEPVQLVSGVARYLENCEQNPTTGVTKYLLRQSLAAKQKKETLKEIEVTGVEKYLKNKKEAPGLSGVAKYLKHLDSLPQPSKVSKYLAKQAVLAAIQTKEIKQSVKQFEATGVAKYLQHQESLPQPSRVAKYMAKQAALAALQVKQAEVEVTGVAKYLQHQESLPQPSRVAKYMAKQAALAAKQVKQPVVQVGPTGVAKYLQHQASLPQISRVAKYMVRQALVEKIKPVATETSVEKYMRHQG